MFATKDRVETWFKPLKNGGWAIVNAGSTKSVLKSEVPGHDVLVFRLKRK